jgi:hypothetical protein
MLDWKIIAAGVVALLFISSIFIGEFGVRDFLSDIVGKIGEWLGGSPFSGVFSTPKAKESNIKIQLFPQDFALSPNEEYDVIVGDMNLSSFQGDMNIFFNTSKIELIQATSEFKVTFPLENVEVHGVNLKTLALEETKFTIEPNITTDSGNLDMSDFLGSAIVNDDSIIFEGKASRLLVTIGNLSWELV